MFSFIKIIFVCLSAAVLSGCFSFRTGNRAVDGALLGTQGLVESKSTRQKNDQKTFERDFDKKMKSDDK